MPVEALVWGAAVGVVAWRAERLLRGLWRDRQALAERTLALKERELALAEQRQAANEDMPDMPIDLQMRCNNESELWAREQMRSVVQQLWAKHRNWDGVRVEVAALDAASVALEMGWSQTQAVS